MLPSTSWIVCLFLQLSAVWSFSLSAPGGFATTIPSTRSKLVIAVTREQGKNKKLVDKLQNGWRQRPELEVLELPCICHATGEDYSTLAPTLESKKWDYVAVTSPEAAKVVASAWNIVRDNPPPVAAVGKATQQVLQEHDIQVSFVPSKATAETLAMELPREGHQTTVLYPASARAKQTLQDNLTSRGFEVTRLNAYDTVTADWSQEMKESAQSVDIACFASPSAVQGWCANTSGNQNVVAACIGVTSAKACQSHGWQDNQIFYSESPGLEGWVESIQRAISSL